MEEAKEKSQKREEIEALSYYKGRYEELSRFNQELLQLLKTQLIHLSTERMTRGSIGPGSKIYQISGMQFRVRYISIPFTVMGVGFGIASSFLSLNPLVTAISLIIGLGSLSSAFIEWLDERKQKPSSKRDQEEEIISLSNRL